MEACLVGVAQALPLVLSIGSSLLTVTAIKAAFDGLLKWLAYLVDLKDITLEVKYFVL